jgi:putative phosphoribosyl transferase
VFEDRAEAGRRLAEKLGAYRNRARAILLALPRGGVEVGLALHASLALPLDVLITRKLRAPENPEYALGALTETGYRYINPDAAPLISGTGGREYLERETAHQAREIERRKALYRNGAGLPTLADRTVLVIDDGIATGSTAIAAVRGLRKLNPSEIVVASPVASTQALDTLGEEADRLVVVSIPDRFFSVGEHYSWFPQVTDSEVVACLETARRAPTGPASGRS